ncbi:MAG: caspase family protein [Halieaceae bacterium]|jgi:hypothetical protein|nr:caspase family protein [Halieaceae bacterium]
MMKRALLVGISSYDNVPDLYCCCADARAMAEVLGRHADHDAARNYACEVMTSDQARIGEGTLRAAVRRLFADFRGGDVLFYFSGHGMITDAGGHLVTQDAQPDDPGYPMTELLRAANSSGVGSALIILDCCNSGAVGGGGLYAQGNQVILSEGVTILAASSPQQEAQEGMEHSVFTELVLDALNGGAADIRGNISAAAIYGYVEQSLGAWEQRPMYKSNARQLNPIRRCEPAVSNRTLSMLTSVFPSPQSRVSLDPSYEHTDDSAIPEHVDRFDAFKALRNARLLRTVNGEDLYFAAMESGSVELTPLGRFYWQLVRNGRV